MSAVPAQMVLELVEQYSRLLREFEAEGTVDRASLSHRLEEIHQLLIRMNLDHLVPDVMER
jgi:hypothetical protein